MSDTSTTRSDSTPKGVLSEKVKKLEHLVNVYLAKDDEPGVQRAQPLRCYCPPRKGFASFEGPER